MILLHQGQVARCPSAPIAPSGKLPLERTQMQHFHVMLLKVSVHSIRPVHEMDKQCLNTPYRMQIRGFVSDFFYNF